VLSPHPTALVSLERDPARDDALLVRFWSGDALHYGATTRVTESPTEVRVEVFTGALPEAQGQAALGVAELQELIVVLDAPLRDRRIVAA
jgi:hypothetical protein